MSHIVQIQTQVRDAAAVRAACQRLQLEPPQEGTFRLFASQATGLGVRLRGWKFPVVCELPTGTLRFDNYGGRWGHQDRLGEFLQAYAAEKTRIEARRKGFAVTEQRLANGSIRLTIQVGAGSAGTGGVA